MEAADLSFAPISFISSESELHSVVRDFLFSLKYYKKQCVSLHCCNPFLRQKLFESVFQDFIKNSRNQDKFQALWRVNWAFTCVKDEDGKTISLAKSAISLGFAQGKLTQSMKLTPLFFNFSAVPMRNFILIRLILEGKLEIEHEIISLEDVKVALRTLGIRNQTHIFAALLALINISDSEFSLPESKCESSLFDLERFCANIMTGTIGNWEEAISRSISLIEKQRDLLGFDTAEKCAELKKFFVQELYSKIYEMIIIFGNEVTKGETQREILVLDSADFQYKEVGDYENLVWNYISEKEKENFFTCVVRDELRKYEFEGVPFHSFSSYPDYSLITFFEESFPKIIENWDKEITVKSYDNSVVSVVNETLSISLLSKVAIFPISALRLRSLLQCDLTISKLVHQFIEALTYNLTSELSALNPELIISKVIRKSASGLSLGQDPFSPVIPIMHFYAKLKPIRTHYIMLSKADLTEDGYHILEITDFYRENFTASCPYLELNDVFYQRFCPGNRLCVTDIPDIMDYLDYKTSEYYCGFTQFFVKGKEKNAAVELVRRLYRKKLKQVISAVKALIILFPKHKSDSLIDQYSSPQFTSLPISMIANSLLPRPISPLSTEWKDVSFQLDPSTLSQYPAPSPPLSKPHTSISDLSEIEELALKLEILEEDVDRYWNNATLNSAAVMHVLDVYQRLVKGTSPKRVRSSSGLPITN